jgi:hypothetical protein
VIDVDQDPRFDPERRFPEPRDVLTICFSLVTITVLPSLIVMGRTITVAQLAHFSVQEYLVSDRIRDGPAKEYSMQGVSANLCIAETCLAYLLHLNKLDSLLSQENDHAKKYVTYQKEVHMNVST